MLIVTRNSATDRRKQIKNEFWADEIAWTGEGEKGWFRVPRTLPLVLVLLSLKEVSGKLDPGRVYLDLLARHRDSGIVDMASDGEHSFAAGYRGARGIRTWKERLKLLEELGFIKSRPIGNAQYGHVLLVHPTIAVQQLRDKGKVPTEVWDLYRTTQIRTREATFEQRIEAIRQAKAAEAKRIEDAKAAAAKAEQAKASAAPKSKKAKSSQSKPSLGKTAPKGKKRPNSRKA